MTRPFTDAALPRVHAVKPSARPRTGSLPPRLVPPAEAGVRAEAHEPGRPPAPAPGGADHAARSRPVSGGSSTTRRSMKKEAASWCL